MMRSTTLYATFAVAASLVAAADGESSVFKGGLWNAGGGSSRPMARPCGKGSLESFT